METCTQTELEHEQTRARQRDAIQKLDDVRREYVGAALKPASSVEAAVRSVLTGRAERLMPSDAEQPTCRATALLSEMVGLAEDDPKLVAEACGPNAARDWRGDQITLSQFISRALRPFGRAVVPVPSNVRQLLDIARGKA